MPFNTLLLTECLVVGETSFGDRDTGVSITLDRQKCETILLFNIDDESNPKCQFRKLVGIKKEEGGKICDLMIFYAKDNKKILCFVELKGSGKLGDASEQVISTCQHFKKFLKQQFSQKISLEIKAFLLLKGSPPQEVDRDRYREKLEQTFGRKNYTISKDENGIGNFLRGDDRSLKGKRKTGRNR